MTEAPKVIWARHLTTVGSVMLGDWGDTIRYVDGTRYIRADAPELVAMVEAVKEAGGHIYGIYGYRVNAALSKWEALTK